MSTVYRKENKTMRNTKRSLDKKKQKGGISDEMIEISQDECISIHDKLVVKNVYSISEYSNNINTESEILRDSKSALINFYAPWCGHCQDLESDWLKISKIFNKGNNIKVMRVNGDKMRMDKHLPEELHVEGYPTIKFFINGKVHDFNDSGHERNKKGIMAWVYETVSAL